jgi:hypothetical protein
MPAIPLLRSRRKKGNPMSYSLHRRISASGEDATGLGRRSSPIITRSYDAGRRLDAAFLPRGTPHAGHRLHQPQAGVAPNSMRPHTSSTH